MRAPARRTRLFAARVLRAAGLTLYLLGAPLAAPGAAAPAPGDEAVPPPAAPAAGALDFAREVRPILSDRCFPCHGPDEHARKAGLRLDRESVAKAPLRSGATAIVPGRPQASELVRRIEHEDPDERMPPAKASRTLSTAERAALVRWIEQGANWSEHWAFVPPVRPPVPTLPPDALAAWRSNPVDAFVWERLAQERLSPSPPADRATLLRRASFDLTGLPPTSEEVTSFEADERPDAYARQVERLLARPAHAERMTLDWLDAARYADTNGYHIDNERSMWRWRDGVLAAFAANQPFDDFTLEQLAGDLLPDATLAQRTASGFHRNHMINFEGGAIDEEYLVEYVADRVQTTATVWMGLTLGCARCHDHKFDPVSQRDFFRLFAFFHQVDEVGLDGKEGNAEPKMLAPLPGQQERRDALTAEIAALAARADAPLPEADARQAEWEAAERERLARRWQPLRPSWVESRKGATLVAGEDGTVVASGANPDTDVFEIVAFTRQQGLTEILLEALADEALPRSGPGRSESGNFLLSRIEVAVAPLDPSVEPAPVPLAAAHSDYAQPGYAAASVLDDDVETGWAVSGHERAGEERLLLLVAERPFGFPNGTGLRIRLHFESRHRQHTLGRFRLSLGGERASHAELLPTEAGTWYAAGPFRSETTPGHPHDVAFPPEASRDLRANDESGAPLWSARPEWHDGEVHRLQGEQSATYALRVLEAPSARTVELVLGSDDGLKVWCNDALVLERDVARTLDAESERVRVPLRPGRNELLLKIVNRAGDHAFAFRLEHDGEPQPPLDVVAALRAQPEADAPGAERVRRYFRAHVSPEWKLLEERLVALREEERRLVAAIPTTMVMSQRSEPRSTHLLERGQYDRPGQEVSAGVPACLPPLPAGAPADRLALARWLVSGEHPLTARVTVNRLWALLFGRGLVVTVEDFGAQGSWPSHPELLDWLAVELVESGWDLRHVLRLLVTSATYRQDSRVDPERAPLDPDARLLSRYPRRRLPAEMIRDNTLAVAGLLVERIGGPSVKSYEPPGTWSDVAYDLDESEYSAQIYRQGTGEDLYRRSLYTFWKRSSPPSSLALFDAPNRELCTVRRSATNTPLQVLALWNDPTYVEAARGLATRMLREAGPTAEERVQRGFRLCTARGPRPEESATLLALLDDRLAHYRGDAQAAAALLSVGESLVERVLDPAELAAWTNVASTLLALDETISQG